jgi:hypothetical protein
MTKTFQGKRVNTYVDGVSTVPGYITLLSILLGACISLLGACVSVPRAQSYSSYDEATKQVDAAPECTDICWVMTARNDNYYEARAYVNGTRVATLPGMMAGAVRIPISRSMLDGAGCIVAFVQLYPDTKKAYSTKECPVRGSRLELAVGESYGGHPLHLYLQEWRIK